MATKSVWRTTQGSPGSKRTNPTMSTEAPIKAATTAQSGKHCKATTPRLGGKPHRRRRWRRRTDSSWAESQNHTRQKQHRQEQLRWHRTSMAISSLKQVDPENLQQTDKRCRDDQIKSGDNLLHMALRWPNPSDQKTASGKRR